MEIDPLIDFEPINWKHLLPVRSLNDLKSLLFGATLSLISILVIRQFFFPVLNLGMVILVVCVHYAGTALIAYLFAKGSYPLLSLSYSRDPSGATSFIELLLTVGHFRSLYCQRYSLSLTKVRNEI